MDAILVNICVFCVVMGEIKCFETLNQLHQLLHKMIGTQNSVTAPNSNMYKNTFNKPTTNILR